MLTSIINSQLTERLVYLILVDGHDSKYLSRLRERLAEPHLNVVRALERMGLELFVEPTDGMFLWARFPHVEGALPLVEASQRGDIMLARGVMFRPLDESSVAGQSRQNQIATTAFSTARPNTRNPTSSNAASISSSNSDTSPHVTTATP